MIKIPYPVQVKAAGLLPMLYKIAEIAEELDLPESTIRSWLKGDAPHQRDAGGHFWINGEELAKWIAGLSRPKESQKLEKDEAYCFRCKEVVPLSEVQIVPGRGKLQYIRGKCLRCGGSLSRGGCVGQSG